MFGTLVIFFFQLHGTMFSVACTVLLYTWHGAFKNQERTAVVHFYTLEITDLLLLFHMMNDQLVKCYYCRLSALTTQLYDTGK